MTTYDPKKTVRVTALPDEPDSPAKSLSDQMRTELEKRNHGEDRDD